MVSIPLRTPEEYQYGWKHARESTASSLSGVHFGHYIAAIRYHYGKNQQINGNNTNVDLNQSPTLEACPQCDARKSCGELFGQKLCIIMLFKADFNNNNKWLGWAIMRNAEKLDEVAPEQYGSCSQKAAGTQCLNKWLFYEYIRAMRILTALCSNDAKSCYNRIVLLIAVLALCWHGASVPAMESMIATLAQLQHHVRLAYDNSECAQGQVDWTNPVAGIGQGNGTSPQIWATVSTPMLTILRQEGFVAMVICAMSKQF